MTAKKGAYAPGDHTEAGRTTAKINIVSWVIILFVLLRTAWKGIK